MRFAARLVAFVLVVGVLAGLCVHYAGSADDHDPYPAADDLATDYDAYVGEEAFLFGTVRSVDEGADRATLEVTSDEGAFELTVRGFTETVDTGGVVQVHGPLEPGRTMDARNVAVVNPSGSSDYYKYAVSAVGAVLVLVLFFRQWRFESDSLAFEVRSDG